MSTRILCSFSRWKSNVHHMSSGSDCTPRCANQLLVIPRRARAQHCAHCSFTMSSGKLCRSDWHECVHCMSLRLHRSVDCEQRLHRMRHRSCERRGWVCRTALPCVRSWSVHQCHQISCLQALSRWTLLRACGCHSLHARFPGSCPCGAFSSKTNWLLSRHVRGRARSPSVQNVPRRHVC